MHRFYLPPGEVSGSGLVLRGREAHHALHVLRVRKGEPVIVLNGAGTQCFCEVESCGRDHIELKVLESRRIEPPPFEVTLVQALPKGKLIESIIQKCTELGVRRVVPLISERVVTRIPESDHSDKQEKWQCIAIEAIKQCGSAWLPVVEAPTTIQEFLARGERPQLTLVGSLQEDARHPREYFRAFQQAHGHMPASVSIWVGPEGDFTTAELQAIHSAGALPINLGPLVLRSETAAMYCLSVVNYELLSP